MKKIFAILLSVAIMFSMAIPAFADEDEIKVTDPWDKYMSKGELTTSDENGETVYKVTGITAAYTSPGVDILPTLKKLMEGNDKITVTIAVDVKIDYAEGFEDEEFPIAGLIRAAEVNEKIKDPNAFKAIYRDAQAGGFADTGGGNYSIRFFENESALDYWTTLEGEVTFTANDINAGLWGKLNVCFDRMNCYEAISAIYIKNTRITLTDYEEGDGEITIDFDTEVIPSTDDVDEAPVDLTVDLTLNADAEDTPALPEGNYLDTKWVKGMAANDPIEGTFNDQPMYSMTGWKTAYGSPFLDILPAVKSAMGEEDEINVYIVFDARVLNYKGLEGTEHGFGIKIRPKTTDLTKELEDFEENYLGSTFKHHNSGDVRLTLLASDKEYITEDWQRFEFIYTFSAEDVEDGLWEAWNLCFDNVNSFKTLGAIQIKNMGVFYGDDYEPINIDEPATDVPETSTPAEKPQGSEDPVVIHKPIGGGKYQITFTESVDTVVEGLVDNNGGNGTIWIIVAVAAVVVLAGVAVGIVTVAKKKNAKEDK